MGWIKRFFIGQAPSLSSEPPPPAQEFAVSNRLCPCTERFLYEPEETCICCYPGLQDEVDFESRRARLFESPKSAREFNKENAAYARRYELG